VLLYIKFAPTSEQSGGEHQDHNNSWMEIPVTMEPNRTSDTGYYAVAHIMGTRWINHQIKQVVLLQLSARNLARAS
jgi:hypothetical protein